MILPNSTEDLPRWSQNIIDRCRASVSSRAGTARTLRTWLYTGSPDGNTAILNRLHPHVDRMASYLYSPNDLRFHIDFSHTYPKEILDKAEVAARVLSRVFEQRDIDLDFGKGVYNALAYGACLPKIMDQKDGIRCKLVMPWQFGVYREDEEDLSQQEAMCETCYITPFELWRRISHLPDAIKLFRRAREHARKQSSPDEPGSFFHSVVLAGTTPVVQTDAPFSTQTGGLVSTQPNPLGATLPAEVAEELICFHELWVWNDELEDYTTIQQCEPDILIAPRYRRKNLFVPEILPYGKIQPNDLNGYFWGRSEIADLQKLQHLLRDRLEDIKKLMSLQYDRLFAFIGGTGMTDEAYDGMREAGFFNLEQGSDIKDVTPQMPKEAFADVQEILTFMDDVSGFRNILSGQGEPGVRAGSHAETLVKTASPRLRDRALMVERQCADLANKVFQCLSAKGATAYWDETGDEFLLSQLPNDYRIMVDSHSSSPIYEEDHKEVAAFLAKANVIDGESLLDLLPVPMRDLLKVRYRNMQAAKAQFLQEHPEMLTKGQGRSHH